MTTMKVSERNRDELAAIAREELGGVTLNDALHRLLTEHRYLATIARLEADPEALADYQAEALALAETDIAVQD
jgi:hypothetical protein